jgi:hypothetical protein
VTGRAVVLLRPIRPEDGLVSFGRQAQNSRSGFVNADFIANFLPGSAREYIV